VSDIPKKKKIAMWLFTFLAMAYLIVESRGAFMHWQENINIWEPHAMLHAIQGAVYTQALCIMVVVLTWIPFRKGERWAWWSVGFIGVALHGAHVIGDAMSHGGLKGAQAAQGSGEMFYAITVTALILYIVGFFLSREFFTKEYIENHSLKSST